MRKIFSLTFIFLCIIIYSFGQFSPDGQTYVVAGIPQGNPTYMGPGLVSPYTGGDNQTLEIHATKVNMGHYNHQTYGSGNNAILNVFSWWDGTEMVKFRTYSETSYFRMFQTQGNKYFAEFVQDGQSQLYLSNYDSHTIGIGTNTPNPNAKLDVNGTILGQRVAIGNIDLNTINNNSDYLLAVNGTAIFNKAKVKLYTTWPDYVFREDYKLPSLEYLEKFIKQNKHLPDMPSAAEVEKNGIDLGDNQALLLKKIEEITLIVIDQNKKIEEQGKKISDLEKRDQNP